MRLFTSPSFSSAAATGHNWRDISRAVLGKLESARAEGGKFNLGFLYISDYLAADAQSILGLFSEVLGINNWVGTVGIGVCASGEEFIDQPAISALIGSFAPESFCMFQAGGSDLTAAENMLKPWLKNHDPMLVFLHGDPVAEEDPALTLRKIEHAVPGFLTGGLSSSRQDHIQFAGTSFQKGLSGLAFSQDIKVATTLSQGCAPISGKHMITRSHEHLIHELDSQGAAKIFENDLRQMAMKKIERDPDQIILETAGPTDQVPEEFKSLFRGEISIAFAVPGTDQKDYLVRNIIGIDEEGAIMVSQEVANGENILFVHRNDQTVKQDLSRSLTELRARVEKDMGKFEPKGALYVSCVARAFSEFNGGGKKGGEMRLVQDIIGDVPLAGFYAGGEICNGRLYGYTGVLTLFL